MRNQASDSELDYESDVDLNISDNEDDCLRFLDLDSPRSSLESISTPRSRHSLLCLAGVKS